MSYLTNSLGATVRGIEKQGAGRIPNTQYQDGGIASLQMGSSKLFGDLKICITLPDELGLTFY